MPEVSVHPAGFIEKRDTLAAEFVAQLSRTITHDQMVAVRMLNADEGENSGTCASHDVCDANMVMHQAFANVFERDPLGDDGMSDDDTDLWNAAWGLAKKDYLAARDTGVEAGSSWLSSRLDVFGLGLNATSLNTLKLLRRGRHTAAERAMKDSVRFLDEALAFDSVVRVLAVRLGVSAED